jgi:sulfatase maturation enzyme AslB (radical SAM superfamily)
LAWFQACSHLFVCGGGCAVHALERTGEMNTSECDGIKKKFEVMVKGVFAHSPDVADSPAVLQAP